MAGPSIFADFGSSRWDFKINP